jgi:amino acid transporter
MKKLIVSCIALIFMNFGINTVSAQEFLPDTISDLFGLLGEDGSGATQFVTSRVQSLLLIGLALLILSAVVYAAFSAYKYISSQGDAGQVEESGKAVKAIFLGIAVLLLSVVGIALIFVFFGTELIGTEVYQVCVSSPNSVGCTGCQGDQGGVIEGFDTLKFQSISGFPVIGNTAVNTAYQNIVAGNGSDVQRITISGTATDVSSNQFLCTYCEYGYFQLSRDGSSSTFRNSNAYRATNDNNDFVELCQEDDN